MFAEIGSKFGKTVIMPPNWGKKMKMKQKDFLENIVRIFTPRKDETGTSCSYFTNTLPDGRFDRAGIHFKTIDEAKDYWRKFAK